MTQLNFGGKPDKSDDDRHLREMAERIRDPYKSKGAAEYDLTRIEVAIKRIARARSWEIGRAGKWLYLQTLAYFQHPDIIERIEQGRRQKGKPYQFIPLCSGFMNRCVYEERDWCDEVRQHQDLQQRRASRSEREQARRDRDSEQLAKERYAYEASLRNWMQGHTDEEWAEVVAEVRAKIPDHGVWEKYDRGDYTDSDPAFIGIIKRRSSK